MTREETKRRAELYSALADGKAIQVQNPVTSKWEYLDINKVGEFMEELNYRIKPEPKYRPFKTQEECWNEMLKHQPFGWIYSKNRSCYYCIISVEEDRIELPPREQSRSKTPLKEFYLKNYHCFFEEALELFKLTFADGTPFGIKEE